MDYSKLFITVVILFIGGCGYRTYQPIQIGKNTYTLQRGAAVPRTEALMQASNTCKKQGLNLILLREGRFDYDFKCVKNTDKSYQKYSNYKQEDLSVKAKIDTTTH